jgi:hypothetical protein
MSYMHELETRLTELLDAFGAGDLSRDKFISEVKIIALESYHNGQASRQSPTPAGPVREVAQEFRKEKRSGQAPYRRTQNYKR